MWTYTLLLTNLSKDNFSNDSLSKRQFIATTVYRILSNQVHELHSHTVERFLWMERISTVEYARRFKCTFRSHSFIYSTRLLLFKVTSCAQLLEGSCWRVCSDGALMRLSSSAVDTRLLRLRYSPHIFSRLRHFGFGHWHA